LVLDPVQLRKYVVGVDQLVPLRDGRQIPYVNLDNAASTPPILPVVESIWRFLPWYASVHRGHGYKSQVSTEVFDTAHQIIGRFFGFDPERHSVILGKNATEALNKAAYRIQVPHGKYVLVSGMEHHSNDLPWRFRANVRFCGLTPEGVLDLDSIDKELRSGKIAVLAICGASNVTGIINPIEKLAEMAHAHGVLFVVDAAQLAPHHAIYLSGPDNDWIAPDLIAVSGHKLYAPFGTGALIGPRDIFRSGIPELIGGGTVISVSQQNVVFAEPPDREEAGTPNVVGALALATALDWLKNTGMDRLFEAERSLTAYAYWGLKHIPGCTVYGPSPEEAKRVGVISFNLDGLPHGLVAAVLSHEYGIGVRHGCFCARPYVHHLLRLQAKDFREIQEHIQSCRWDKLPGMVRISFGFYNTREEVDYFLDAIRDIRSLSNRYLQEYRPTPPVGDFRPVR
jgi:cysteine desulfurase/selenocysteine lyase